MRRFSLPPSLPARGIRNRAKRTAEFGLVQRARARARFANVTRWNRMSCYPAACTLHMHALPCCSTLRSSPFAPVRPPVPLPFRPMHSPRGRGFSSWLLAPFSNPVREPGDKSPPRHGHHRRVAISLEPSFIDSIFPQPAHPLDFNE